MLKQIWKRICDALFDAPQTEETLRNVYRNMPDAELARVRPGELMPQARAVWQEEISRRKKR